MVEVEVEAQAMQRVRMWVWVRDLRRWILVNGTVEYTSRRAGEFSGWLQTLCWTRCLNVYLLMGGWGKRAQQRAGWVKESQAVQLLDECVGQQAPLSLSFMRRGWQGRAHV